VTLSQGGNVKNELWSVLKPEGHCVAKIKIIGKVITEGSAAPSVQKVSGRRHTAGVAAPKPQKLPKPPGGSGESGKGGKGGGK
jgi:hypothetical protein